MDIKAYHESRKKLRDKIIHLRSLRDRLEMKYPAFVQQMSSDVRQRMRFLDREITRLSNPDLTVAFVGGFSAGKSSLVNAFLGRYLLPEATKVTTAVPTFVRMTSTTEEYAELHYLTESEIEELDEKFRKAIADLLDDTRIAALPYKELMERVKPHVQEGRGSQLIEQFKKFYEQRKYRKAEPSRVVEKEPIAAAREIIRNESEAMFLDRVVLYINQSDLPEDVVLVDLPGVSVPNPRHREITFRFVEREAHAIVFVLMATRLFDKDEIEIVELIRAGEKKISDKIFWVLNRWDALSPQQQRQTLQDFEKKMVEFNIQNRRPAFTTNALHGLLSQLSLRPESLHDAWSDALEDHMKDYRENLEANYHGSHDLAFQESGIPDLRKHVVGFLNRELRHTIMSSAFENTKSNFIDPLLFYLRRAKEEDDSYVSEDLRHQEKETFRKEVESVVKERIEEIRSQLGGLRREIAARRSDILLAKTKELISGLEERIELGPETDAFQIYQEIIAEKELRRYPYYFEIEIRIVDNLNTMLKKSFRKIVNAQVDSIFKDLLAKVRPVLDRALQDVNAEPEVARQLHEVLKEEEKTFRDRVDGIVMDLASQLDELLLYKPGLYSRMSGKNNILKGLEAAARMGFEKFSTERSVVHMDFQRKTEQIRKTLIHHYIDRVREYHQQVAAKIIPIIINNMKQIEDGIVEGIRGKYRSVLEVIISERVSREFEDRRRKVEDRSVWFRKMIEELEGAEREMSSILGGMQS